MQTLNLARKEYGTIDYEIINFPDGQKHLRLLTELNHKDMAQVVCRITNGDDLFILMQVADILNRHCIVWELDIKYLLAARTDRLFSMSEAHSLDVIIKIIEGLNAKDVDILEPHNNTKIGKCSDTPLYPKKGVVLAFPDKGAYDRKSWLVESDGMIVCSKARDTKSGILKHFAIDSSCDCNDKDVVLLDDLCDGGGTFMGLEPMLRKLNPKSLTLQVAHAIQLEGIKKVASVYDKVIITNSYADWDRVALPSNVEVVDALK